MQVIDIINDFSDCTDNWKVGKSNYWILANEEELKEIQNKISLENNFTEFNEVLKRDSSKIIFFDSYMFLRFNILAYRNEIIKVRELDIYLSKDYIITVYNNNITVIKELIDDIKNLKNCFTLKNNPKPSMILYYILDRMILKNL
nr:CorA family divalent cation transporter [Clostridium novyi]